MLQKFILLVFFIKILQLNANDCYTHLLQDTLASYTCSDSGLFTSTSFDQIVQNPSKQLTVAISIRPSSLCGISSDFNFFTVSIDTSSGRKKIMILKYDAINDQVIFQTEGSAIIQGIQTRTITFLGNPFNVYLSVNLASGANTIYVGGLMTDGSYVASSTTVSYGSTWLFDSSLRISVCADDDGTTLFNSIACIATNLKVQQSLYYSTSVINFANIATILGDYKLNKVKENILTDSKGTLGSIALSTSTNSPTWISDVGLDFTSTSQEVQIPTFIPSSSGLTIEVSVAFTFYIKIDSVPALSTPATIFSYYSNSISSEVFKLEITSNMKLKPYIETNSQEGATALVQGQWAQVYMGCIYSSGGFSAVIIQIDGGDTDSAPGLSRMSASSIFSSADTIKIGGFIGQLRRFQIYSPGAFQLAPDSCYPSTCQTHIGYSTTPMCIFSICSTTSGTYPSFGTCEDCPTGCATCTDATTCQSCDGKYYLSGTTCLACPDATFTASSTSTTCTNCPQHCTSCTDSQTCQTCSSGYGLLNNLCMLCPAGTYLSSDQLCKTISKTVQDTLTTSQLVTSAATQASSVISQGSAVSLSAAVSGKIFSQIKYLNISYSGELQVALLTWLPSFVSLGLTPNMPLSMEENIPERHTPYVFAKYDVPSSFLINFWENLGIIIFVTILWIVFKGLELALKSQRNSWITPLARKACIMTQNFLITAFFGVYGDLVLYSLVEYRSFVFGWNLSLLSFLFSVTLLIAMFASFWYQIRLLMNYQKVKNQKEELEKFTKANEGSQVLFKDMKDYSLAPQLFLFFLSGRDLIFSLLLATMFEYPLIQTLIFFILTCLMIVYLLLKKPFQSTFDLIQQMFFEVISFAVSICILINAVLDSGDYIATSTRTSLGKTVIIFNLIFNFGTALFMLFMIFSLIKEAYLKYKQKSAQKKITKLSHHRLQQSSNAFDQSQSSNKKPGLNLDSEIDSLHQSSLDMSPPPKQLDFRLNQEPRNTSMNSLLQPSNDHQMIIQRKQRILRKQPLHHNRQLGPLNGLDSKQGVSIENNVHSNESPKKRRVLNLE